MTTPLSLTEEQPGGAKSSADSTRIQVRDGGRSVLVRVIGPLDMEHAETFLTQLVRVCTPNRRVVVDLLQTDYVDSSGVRAIMQLQSRLAPVRGELRLVIRPSSRVERVFTLLRLMDQFQVFRSVSDAWDGSATA